MNKITRRDFLKLGGLSLGTLAFSPSLGTWIDFDDSRYVRVATNSVSVYSKPSDQSSIVSTWYRDELLHVYGEVGAEEPVINPVWYRVWGGYIHRARLQPVKVIFNKTLPSVEAGIPRLVEMTVPFSTPWRTNQIYGWQQLGFRLYYGSLHWVEAIEPGPTGELWYRIYDDLTGFPYYVNPMHMRPLPLDEFSPLTPEIPVEGKRVEVNLTTQTLLAFEYDRQVLKTTIRSSGIPNGSRDANGLPTKTPEGEFRIMDKMPNKHMGNGNLFADFTDYELPDDDGAVEEFKRAAQYGPKHANSRYYLGLTLLQNKKNIQEGIKAWEDYLKVEPRGQRASQVRIEIERQTTEMAGDKYQKAH